MNQAATVVKHKIKTSILKNPGDADRVVDLLASLEGMQNIDLNVNAIRLTYDTTSLQFSGILHTLKQAQLLNKPGWLDALKFSCYNYTDMNIRDNATAPSLPCCSDPAASMEDCQDGPCKR